MHAIRLISLSSANSSCLLLSSSSSSHLSLRNETRATHPFRLHRISTPLHITSVASSDYSTINSTTPSSTSETFDWFSHWYPLAHICDLDKHAPTAKTVMGLDVVVWWDRKEGAWKVFDDLCPHRLAPLSGGRIDPQGRLQCVYHGWCFDGAGSCKYIPQAPSLGPPVHKNKKACVAVYPSVEQNKILWFWPNSNPKFRDILKDERPPYIPELDDPSYSTITATRDFHYGYEVLIENITDPAHFPYAHFGLLKYMKHVDPGRFETDIEGGAPLNITVEKSDINGFTAKHETGYFKFVPPCLFYGESMHFSPSSQQETDKPSKEKKKTVLIFMCVPVGPGKSRAIFSSPRNFDTWINKIIPRWCVHIGLNLVTDSDHYLLHLQERKIASGGNWLKACYIPTKSDAMVLAYRTWLKRYANNQINWGPTNLTLSPILPREQLMDRYWSHVVQCTDCSGALKALKAVEVSLQVISVAIIGFLAIAKNNLASNATKVPVVSFAILCFAASRWLSHFIYKTFFFHDYNHTFNDSASNGTD